MAESVGRKLQQARLARKLEIEDVAETTKIRPERIIDLEADEYGLFPNLTYAKSFLAKYAKFLGVNIQNELDNFQVERAISLHAYQYLTPPPQPKHLHEPRRISPRGFRVPPVVVAILLLIVLVGVPLFSYLALNVPRVVGAKLTGEKFGESERSRSRSPKMAVEEPSDALQSQIKPPVSDDNPVAASKNPKQDEDPKDESGPASSPLQARTEDGVEVRKALPASMPQSSTIADSQTRTVVPTFPDKKLEVRILKRTYVKVTKDQEGAQPVFEGFAGPESRPIVVAGKRFWVHVLDKGAVEVRKDGQLVPSNSGDIVIN
jgi:cytoskeletal protein RodZ